jgi:hypothetical protein
MGQPPRAILTDAMSAEEALVRLRTACVPGAPLVDGQGFYRGVVDIGVLEERLRRDSSATVDEVLDPTAIAVSSSAPANAALDALTQTGRDWVTVTGPSREVTGVIGASDVVMAYRLTLERSLNHIAEVTPDTVLIEEKIGEGSPLAALPVARVHLPTGCIILNAQREQEFLFVTGATQLREGDVVNAVVGTAHRDAVAALMRGPEDSGGPTTPNENQLI